METYKYKCPICGWEGDDSEIVELAGYLWDYTNHEACPRCWKEGVIDSPVELIVNKGNLNLNNRISNLS